MAEVVPRYIPYLGPIYDGIHEGKRIKITGSVPHEADKFNVNLNCGNNSIFEGEPDYTLDISVRFKINTVVRNIYQDYVWGTEERSGPFPFAVGRPFTMVIVVERTAYKIFVNGQHCWDFVHRIPFARARSIMIDGDVSIDRIQFLNYVPPKVVSPPPTTPVTVSGASSDHGQPLPCVFPIHGGIRPGMSIYISGSPTSNPNRFSLNIQKGNLTHPPPDIAFQFDVRFYNYSIVRNSRLNDVWYSEEKMISHFPFQPGNNFDVVITVQSDVYVVMVNGQNFVSFRHRLNTFSHFNVLSIENDAIITSIKYI